LPLESGNGGEDGRMRAIQRLRRRLETTGCDYGIEALQVVQGEIVHVSFPDSVYPFFVIYPKTCRN